ncbi:MAG: hypothetical protein IH971_07770 [Candidatus Marinimicrobia bacterium]|nr:hypothetical protein [Candidatus Neomarinimicrobiota bacterium]
MRVLPLTFAHPSDDDKTRPDDRVALSGLMGLAPGSTVKLTLRHADSTEEKVDLQHTLNESQIEWFRAGSALNVISAAGEK